MVPRTFLACAAVLTSLTFAAGAGAQVGTDPPADSPAGQVYELPLERARGDAAPRKARAGGAAGAGDDGSVYRSENNFGSSSRVPGIDRERGARPGAGAGAGAGAEVLARNTPATDVPGTDEGEGDSPALKGLALLGMIGLVGAIGFLARRSWSS